MRRTRHRYGNLRCQVGDLWLPDIPEGRAIPVVVLIHGGYWRSIYTKALMNGLARATVERGWAAWNIEYRRIGLLGGGGGWPSTFDDISRAVDHVERLPGVDAQRLVTCGHSVGGCFALWAAAGPEARRRATGSEPIVRPAAAVSLAGVVDLVRGHELWLGDGAVSRFLGGSPEERPEPYRAGSPAAILPIGVPQVLVHGLSDTVVPPSMSSDYLNLGRGLGDDVSYVPLKGLGHRGLIDPACESWPVIAQHLEGLFSL